MVPVQFLGLLLIGAAAFLILWGEGLLKSKPALFLSSAVILTAMVLRALCMEHETLDYQNFLQGWVQFFRDKGGWSALRYSVGNYNVPYLYFLALFSYLPVWDLYLIKLLSVAFDVLLAWGALHIVKHFSQTFTARLAAFYLTLLLPTVLLNGAYWGQCDSIYAAFGLWSLAFALEERGVMAMAAAALSFAFKLQAVFLLPVFLLFLIARKLQWYHLPVFPLTYALTVLPAVLAGRPPLDTLLLYASQTGSIGSGLNYNSPSVFAFPLPALDPERLSMLGIGAAFALVALLSLFCLVQRDRLSDRSLLTCALLLSLGIPFLLPHMHDRYFFLADVLSLVLAITEPRLLLAPLGVSFASLLGYHAYLQGRYLLPMSYGAAALCGAMLLLLVYLPLTLEPRYGGGRARRGKRRQGR